MTGRTFFDTNVLVYADDADAGAKRERAQALLRDAATRGGAVLSTQVLQEFYVAETRKLGVAPKIARRKTEALARLDVVVVEPDLVLAAIDLHQRERISFWDALIVKAASAAACSRLWTEDLAHGAVIDGVRIENPFLPARDGPPR